MIGGTEAMEKEVVGYCESIDRKEESQIKQERQDQKVRESNSFHNQKDAQSIIRSEGHQENTDKEENKVNNLIENEVSKIFNNVIKEVQELQQNKRRKESLRTWVELRRLLIAPAFHK